MHAVELEIAVNGTQHRLAVTAERSLLSVLRDELGLTGAKEGCDDSECGACMVLLDGRPVNACSFLALQAAGRAVTTIEGIARDGRLSHLQQAMVETGGVQCGYCTPGVVISATALLSRTSSPTDDEVQEALAGNLCRCTGYAKIFAAVHEAARRERDDRAGGHEAVSEGRS